MTIIKEKKKEKKGGLTATNSVVRICHSRVRLGELCKTALESRGERLKNPDLPSISETST